MKPNKHEFNKLAAQLASQVPDEVRRYMSEIGRKGGASGKGRSFSSEHQAKAAAARWEKWRTERERKREEAKGD